MDLWKWKNRSNNKSWSTDNEQHDRFSIWFCPWPFLSLVDRLIEFHLDSMSDSVRTSFTSLPSRSFRHLQDQYKDHPRPHPPLIKSNSTANDDSTRLSSSGLRRSTDPHTPSRAFRYLQDQLPINRALTVNNRDDIAELYNKGKFRWKSIENIVFISVPPSIRAHEPEAPRYRGSAVPSRSFRFLQKMTEDNHQETDGGKLNRSFSLSSSMKS